MTIILIRYNKTYFNFDPFCLIFPQGQLGKSHSWGRRCHQSDNIDWGPKTANRIANSKITWNPWIYGAWLSIYKIVKFYIKNGSSYVIDVAAYMFWRPHLFICVRVHPEVIRKPWRVIWVVLALSLLYLYLMIVFLKLLVNLEISAVWFICDWKYNLILFAWLHSPNMLLLLFINDHRWRAEDTLTFKISRSGIFLL